MHMTLPTEIRRLIAATQGETLQASAQHAAYEAVLAAQTAGAPGSVRAAILVAYVEEWEAMEAAIDELGRLSALDG